MNVLLLGVPSELFFNVKQLVRGKWIKELRFCLTKAPFLGRFHDATLNYRSD